MADLTTVPTQPEYVQWRNEVLNMANPDSGQKIWTQGQFNQAVGPLVAGRNWGQINEDLTIFLAGL